MASSSPEPFLSAFLAKLTETLQPPAWMVQEVQRRLVLLLNHVLQQEPEAQARLKRQAGRMVEAHWRIFNVRLVATPAGLLDLGAPGGQPDLTLNVAEESPWALAQAALRGDKPAVRIAGDVQLAAEVQWLVDHVRWDLEEDLSRILGDAPAHALSLTVRRMVESVREFAARAPAFGPRGATPAPTPSPGREGAGSP